MEIDLSLKIDHQKEEECKEKFEQKDEEEEEEEDYQVLQAKDQKEKLMGVEEEVFLPHKIINGGLEVLHIQNPFEFFFNLFLSPFMIE